MLSANFRPFCSGPNVIITPYMPAIWFDNDACGHVNNDSKWTLYFNLGETIASTISDSRKVNPCSKCYLVVTILLIQSLWNYASGYLKFTTRNTDEISLATALKLEELVEAKWCIYASVNKTTVVSDNGLSPVRHQAIIWTSADILLIGQ